MACSALSLDGALDLVAGLVEVLLDLRRVDAAVLNEPLQGEPRHLAPHGVEARHHDGLGRVVDDEVAARDLLEGANVTALAPDDAPLELVVRERTDVTARSPAYSPA
jgi:hypothetical protein